MIISVYLKPLIYKNSEILNGVLFDESAYKSIPESNAIYMLNAPSGDGEELENPLECEFDSFAEDCKWLANEAGLTVTETERTAESDRILYTVTVGRSEAQYCSIYLEIKISGTPFDESFPEDYKATVLEHITPEKLLDGVTVAAGIDFQVAKVTVDKAEESSWWQSLDRIFDKLKYCLRGNENGNKDIQPHEGG